MGQYREIAAAVRADIESGVYRRGTRIPSEKRLAEQYGVSRPVINRALRLLRSQGLIRSHHGGQRGTIVNPIPPIRRTATTRHTKTVREAGSSRGAFDGELRALGLEPRVELVRTGPVTPPDEVAEILGLGVDEVAAIRDRRMYANDTPVQLATSYVPWSIAAGTPITQPDTGVGGTYSRLAELGYPVRRLRELVVKRLPTDEERGLLAMDDDQAVFEIRRTALSDNDRAVEVTVHVMPAHQWQLEYEWEIDS